MPPRLGSRTAFALVSLTGFLLVFGSTVRAHGAGLSCPDWPLCFGRVVPEFDFHVYLEFGHRVVAGLVSLGFIGQAVRFWRNGAFGASEGLRRLYALAAVALGAQVVLGGLTVLHLLAEWTVASHLVTGNTFCALLLLIALTVRELETRPARAALSPWARNLAVLMVVLVPVQLALGGLVAGSHAGLACGTWPSCNGAGWFPTFSGLVGLQVTHRVVAYTLAALAVVNAVVQRGATRKPALLVLAAVAVQVAIGVSNVLLRLPVEVTLLHSAGAACVMLSSTWLAAEGVRSPVASTNPSALGAVVAK